MTTAEKPLTTAAKNLGIYFAIASEGPDNINLILEFLEECGGQYEDEIISDVVAGWLSVENDTPQSETDTWLVFGEAIARLLAVDDGSHYDRTSYLYGKMESEGHRAIRFIAAVPQLHQNSFLLGLGLEGFKTDELNNKETI